MSGTQTFTFLPPSGNVWIAGDVQFTAPVVTETDIGTVQSFLGTGSTFALTASSTSSGTPNSNIVQMTWGGGHAGVSTAGSGFTLNFSYSLSIPSGAHAITAITQLLITDTTSGSYNLSATEVVTNSAGATVATSVWTPASGSTPIFLSQGYQSLSVSVTVQASIGAGQTGAVQFSAVQQSFLESPVTAAPAITVDKQISIDGIHWYEVGQNNLAGPTVLAGDKVYERAIVVDTGNTALTGVTVADLNGLAGGAFTFSGATSISMTAGQTITSDIGTIASAVAGTNYDTAIATGTVSSGGTVTNTDTADYTGVKPAITIDKQISVDGGKTWLDQGVNNLAQDPTVLANAMVDERVIVVNTGGIALNNATVTDVSNTGGVFPPDFTFNGLTSVGTLGVGQTITSDVASFTASAGYQLDTATVAATATDTVNTATVTASDQANYTGAVITGASTPIVVDKQISVNGGATWQDMGVNNLTQDPTVFVGSTVEERVIVSDVGSLALTNVSVSDAIGNLAAGGFTFSGGATTSIAANGSVTSDVMTITAVSGYQLDTATATGTVTDNSGNTGTVTATDQANYTGVTPSISIDKQISVNGGATWQDMGVNNLAQDPIVLTGATIEERVIVTNTGSIALTSMSVSDISTTGTFPADFTFNGGTAVVGTLGANQTITSDVATFHASAGQQLDTATASATATDSADNTKPVSATDQANYIGVTPSIAIDKQVSVNGGLTWVDQGQNVLNDPSILTGGTVEERVIVTNTGSIGLGNVAVTDIITVGSGVAQSFALASGSLAAGASETSGVVSFAALSGYQQDQATVSGTATDSASNSATTKATDKADYTGISGAISLDKQVSVDGGATWQDIGQGVLQDPLATVGGTVLERVIVVNTGSIALNNISVSDVESAGTGTPASFTFAAGATATLAAGATIISNVATLTAASGHNIDTATATGTYTDTINTGTVSASDKADYTGTVVSTGTPGISVLKVPCSVVVCSGQSETYTFYVTNTGSVALTNVQIKDNIGTAANPDYVTPTAVTSGGYNVGDTNHDGILSVGETWQYTETVTLTGTAAAGGSYGNGGSGDKSGSGGSCGSGSGDNQQSVSGSNCNTGSSGSGDNQQSGSGWGQSGSGGSSWGSSGSGWGSSGSGDNQQSGSGSNCNTGSSGSGGTQGSGSGGNSLSALTTSQIDALTKGASYGPAAAATFTDGPVTVASGATSELLTGPKASCADSVLLVVSASAADVASLGNQTITMKVGSETVSFSASDFSTSAADGFPSSIGGIANGQVNGISFPTAEHAAVDLTYNSSLASLFGGTGSNIAPVTITSPVNLRVDVFGDHNGTIIDNAANSGAEGVTGGGSSGGGSGGGSGGSGPTYTGVADTVTVSATTSGGTSVSASDTKEVLVLGSSSASCGSGSGGSSGGGSCGSGSGDQSGSGNGCNTGSSGSGDNQQSGSGDNSGSSSGWGSSGSGDQSGSGSGCSTGSSGSGDNQQSGSGDNSGSGSGWGSSGWGDQSGSGSGCSTGSSGSGDNNSGSGDNSGSSSCGSSGSGDQSGSGSVCNTGSSGSGDNNSGSGCGTTTSSSNACNSGISLNGTAPTGNLPTLYGSPDTLEFTYNPGNTVSLAQGSTALATVTGGNANSLAFMEFSNNANPFATNSQIYFEGAVKAGENIFADATINPLTNTANSAATNHFSTAAGAELYGFVFTSQAAFLAGQQPIESMTLSTASGHGMSLGDTIGSVKLVGYVGNTGGHLIS